MQPPPQKIKSIIAYRLTKCQCIEIIIPFSATSTFEIVSFLSCECYFIPSLK